MKIAVITLFPEMFSAITQYGVTRRAFESGAVEIKFFNPREYTSDKHQTVDDRPYGGGPGMVMLAEPLRDAITAAKAWATDTSSGDVPKVVYLSPQGQTLSQQKVDSFAGQGNVVLVAGRYEGVDQRVINSYIDEEVSVGDYVVSGGELPAMILIDAVIRQIPGVLGDAQSAEQDSFVSGLLDWPHYTRPEVFEDSKVPDVLLSGNHQRIARWRLKQALGRTWQVRPDLLKQKQLNAAEQALLDEFIQEHKVNS